MFSKNYLKKPYTRIIIPDDDGSYAAEILEFPGCRAQGNSPDEAINNLNEAAISWIETCKENGFSIPEPFMNQGFGGKIALRLPRSIHKQAARFAARDGVSLNQFLLSAIAEHIGAEKLYSSIMDNLENRISTLATKFIAVNIINDLFTDTRFNQIRRINAPLQLQEKTAVTEGIQKETIQCLKLQ
jgi:predicted RNase H-like HicB family nuclease